MTKKQISSKTKEYLKSALITFVVGFCITVVPLLNDLTLETVKSGALSGVLFAGARTGFKMLFEWVASNFGSK